MTRLSTIDVGFLLTESHHSPKHVACLQVFRLPRGKGPAWLRRMLDELRQIKPGFPFNQKLKLNRLLQAELVPDQQIEMDYHVRHTVLPKPGNDERLWELTARMHANLLDRERPLWEFHLIEGLTDRRFAFYTKLHHVLADGVTMNRWFSESGSRSARALNTHPIWRRQEPPTSRRSENPSYAKLMFEGIQMLGGGIQTAFDLNRLSAKLLQRRFLDRDLDVTLPLGAPRTPLNVVSGAARNIAVTSYPLELIRDIGHAQDATINDVLMTLCDLAVHRYFEEKGDVLRKPLVVYMPVNLRRNNDSEKGNLISLLQVRMASNHQDPLAALRQIKASSRTAREVFSGFGKPAIQLYSLMVALLAQFEESLKLDRVLPPATNLVISNVPGPSKPLYFRGAKSLNAYPISTLPPLTALNITANSYAGIMNIGLVSGRTAIPDLDAMTRYLDDAVAQLAEATGVN